MNVYMLHDIREFNPHFFPERYKMPYFIEPNQFDSLLRKLICTNTHVLTFNDSLSIKAESNHFDISFLTFDDGLKDHIIIARKLHKLNIRAAFFIPSGPISEKSIIDSHKIQFILASTEPIKLVEQVQILFEDYYNRSSKELEHYFTSKWSDNIWPREMVYFTRLMREYPDNLWKRNLLDQLFNKYVTSDAISFSEDFYLNLEDVKEIMSMGHYIGGHGHYSYDLRFEDINTIEHELDQMDMFLSQFSQDHKIYAYANGGFTDYVLQQVILRGYDFAFTTGHRSVISDDSNWILPRIDATKTDLITA